MSFPRAEALALAGLIAAVGVSACAPWQASGGAKRDGQAVLSWRTESEEDNYGFFLERAESADGPFRVVTDTIIAGHGTTNAPHEYSYTDRGLEVGREYHYRLWTISYQGRKDLMATIRHVAKGGDGNERTKP
jgi:hypothetical protein